MFTIETVFCFELLESEKQAQRSSETSGRDIPKDMSLRQPCNLISTVPPTPKFRVCNGISP